MEKSVLNPSIPTHFRSACRLPRRTAHLLALTAGMLCLLATACVSSAPTPGSAPIVASTPPPTLPCAPAVVYRPASPEAPPSPLMTPSPLVTPCGGSLKATIYTKNGDCTRENCLFFTQQHGEGDLPIGLAALEGYYQQTQEKGMDALIHTCDSFLVTGGSTQLIDTLLTLAEEGQYRKNAQNQPLIHLDLDPLLPGEQRQVTASTTGKPVTLLLFAHQPSHMGVPACFTRFEILRVESR